MTHDTPEPPASARAITARSPLRPGDFLLAWSARLSAIFVLLMLVALLVVLVTAAWPAIARFGTGFLTGTEWRANALSRPMLDDAGKVIMEDGEVVMQTIEPVFGALPVIYGTIVSSALALLFAVPLSIGAALFLVRVAPRWKIEPAISFLVEFLASIPSIAYGIWGLFVLAPFLQAHLGPALRGLLGDVPGLRWLFYETATVAGKVVEREIPITGRSMLSAGLVLAIMIIPIVTSVARDVLRAVPRTQVEGSLALGATWWQSSWLMLRYARSGLFGAVMLGLARAAGETMAVTMVIGNANQIAASIFAPGQTMASLLANEFGDPGEGFHRAALLNVALILLVMSLAFNMLARWLVVGSGSKTASGN